METAGAGTGPAMLKLQILGGINLQSSNGLEVRSVLTGPKRVALLTCLALRSAQGFQRRDAIIGLIWPEMPQKRARHALRNTLHSIRSVLGTGVVINRGDEDVGIAPGTMWCDAVAFEETMERGRPLDAIDLYQGELLPAFFIPEAAEFERWLDAERRRLGALATDAAWLSVECCERRGDDGAAQRYARRAVELQPADEVGVRRLITLLERLGDRSGAISAYEDFSDRFRSDYGLEPSLETKQLMRSVGSD